MFREDVRIFFLGGRGKADITTNFEKIAKIQIFTLCQANFGGATAPPAPPLASSLHVLHPNKLDFKKESHIWLLTSLHTCLDTFLFLVL